MEFFAETAVRNPNPSWGDAELQQLLTIAHLPQLCASINEVLADEGERGAVYCVWGKFAVNREEIRGGVRFSLPDCPNALAWSVTLDGKGKTLTVHCTINKKEHDEDFVQSMRAFVEDWVAGLERLPDLERVRVQA